jgi:hypothetical protein
MHYAKNVVKITRMENGGGQTASPFNPKRARRKEGEAPARPRCPAIRLPQRMAVSEAGLAIRETSTWHAKRADTSLTVKPAANLGKI